MKDPIEQRFRRNLERVQVLLALYQSSEELGRDETIHPTDLLRASVVFLHATLEDVVRSVLEWRLPEAAPEALEEISLLGCARRTRFSLADLARHRDKSVVEVLSRSVESSLAESSFNHPGELERALGKIGVDDLQKITLSYDPPGALTAVPR